MSDIISFFKENTIVKVTFIISIVSFIFSIYNFIIHILENWKRLEVSTNSLTKRYGETQYIHLDLINKSCKPISITNIKIMQDEKTMTTSKFKILYLSKKGVNYYTSPIPFSISELGCYSGYFKINADSESCINENQRIKIIISTNRGRVRKNIVTTFYELAQAIDV